MASGPEQQVNPPTPADEVVVTANTPPEHALVTGLAVSVGNQAYQRAIARESPSRQSPSSPGPVATRDHANWIEIERELARTATLRRSLSRDRADRGPDPRREPPSVATPDAGPSDAGHPVPDLEATKRKTEAMIQTARSMGFGYAADNLEHWYRGSGAPRVMPAEFFSREMFVIDHLRNTHGKQFALGAENRAKAARLKSGETTTMRWTDSVRSPTDREIFYALGGFTVESTMEVTASEIPDDPSGSMLITVTRWTVTCSDDYNFDPGKTAMIPGFGRVTDAEMDALRAAGLAKNYRVLSTSFDALALLGGKIEVAVPRRDTADAGVPP